MTPPFSEGDLVRIKGNPHLGLHCVDSCEFFDGTNPGVAPYWLCHTTEIREPIDWSKIPEGATGIVASAAWQGSADHLVRA